MPSRRTFTGPVSEMQPLTTHDEILTLLSESCSPETQNNIRVIKLLRTEHMLQLSSHDLLESQVLLVGIGVRCKDTNHSNGLFMADP